MAFVKHRHDQMHRGQVPADQLAEGTPDPGDTPHYQYDGSVAWEPESGGASTLDGLDDVSADSPDEGDLLRFDGTEWVKTTLRPEPLMASDGSVQLDSAGGPQMHEVAW